MANGVSLNELMASLGSHAFTSTKRNAAKNRASGTNTFNVDPRKGYLRKPGVELTAEPLDWLSQRLDNSFQRWGNAPSSRPSLDRLVDAAAATYLLVSGDWRPADCESVDSDVVPDQRRAYGGTKWAPGALDLEQS